MPITTLDAKTALILIDLQKGIVGMPLAHPVADVLGNARQLADAFRTAGLLEEVGEGLLAVAVEVGQQPTDHTVTKRTWGAFTNTDLADYLKSRGVTQVVIGGISTSMGVESTARQAHELGFHVTIALDATTDMNADAYTNSVTRIFPRLGETGTTLGILDLLVA